MASVGDGVAGRIDEIAPDVPLNTPSMPEASTVGDRIDTSDNRNAKPKLLELCAVDYTVYYFVLPLARVLRKHFDVHMVSSDGTYAERIRAEGFTYHSVTLQRSINVFSHIRAFFRLRKLMARERYQVVHTHTPIASLIGRAAARAAGVPVIVYTSHGFYFHERSHPIMRRFFVFLEKAAGRFTDLIFTVSGEDRTAAIDLAIAASDRVVHVGNGVDLVRFDRDRLAPEKSSVRAELGIPDAHQVICTVGRLVREKGFVELVDAFARVVKTLPDTHLLFVGGALDTDPDDASRAIKERMSEYGIGDRVHLLSVRDDVERVLCASDVFVLPSHREGMPVSVLEAMAMGLPVVATDIRGSREAVVEGETGRLVPVADVARLAEAITELLENGDLRARFGAEAARIAREKYDENHVIGHQVNALREACERKRMPRA
jgi:glycosyltransferase involved in cell wall biosynthesis